MKNNNPQTYYWPPEWAKQSAVMLTWPHQETIWAETLAHIDQVFVEVAKQVALREKLIITCCNDEHRKHVRALLSHQGIDLTQIAIYLAKSDDIWVRDHGPITVFNQDKPLLLDFDFNGWGNKYPASHDNEIVRMLYQQHAFDDTPMSKQNLVLEGGSIETDGEGTLLTTSSCLLAKSRNPKFTQTEITQLLQEYLGIKKILWLNHGYLAGDDTDGHIDTLARFINPYTICYVQSTDENDEHFIPLKEMEKELGSFTNYQGNPYQLIPLPLPKARYAAYDGRRLPATYANFLIINQAVLVPTYEDPELDDNVLRVLTHAFPDRQIIGINALPVIEWYGSLHCMTMQLPQGVFA